MSKAKINVRVCSNGYIVNVNGNESIAKNKKELSEVIGNVFVVSIETVKDKKEFNFDVEAKAE